MPKFKGEKYKLRWQGRSGFAWLAIARLSVVPVGLVGGDDVYHGLVERDSLLGRAGQFIGSRVGGRPDMAIRRCGSGADPAARIRSGCICASVHHRHRQTRPYPGGPVELDVKNRTQRAWRQSWPTCSDCARTTRIGT